MKVFLLVFFFFLNLSVMANEIQVFTSNTMRIDLDKNSTLIEIIYCKTGAKCVDLVKKDPETGNVLMNGFAYHSAVAVGSDTLKSSSSMSHSSVSNVQAGAVGALAGLAVVSSVYFIHDIWSGFTKDYEYIISSYVKNSLGEETLLATLIVSNDELSDKEAKKIAFEDQKKLLIGGK